ncbi:MAG: hypothetical protein NT069_22265 [Planctomycetota bacterium]|nr:hypothetical protein [Planctomycetota bacterium]
MTDEPTPGIPSQVHRGRFGLTVGPANGRCLNLNATDEVTWPIGQSKRSCYDQSVYGDVPQRVRGHLLVGTMNQIPATFLG